MGLDVSKSPFLRHAYDGVGFHHLETYLHLLDGRKSAAGACRDPGPVNKTSGMLRDESVPPCWYVPANKGLVLNGRVRWVAAERETDDLPVPDERLALSELD